MAKGLGALDRGMSSFLKKRQGKQDKADKIRGEAAFHKANQTGWAEAVKSGQVPANSSPIFMEAYKRQQGNLMGTSMRDNFNAAYQQWDGRNSDDPEVFQEFLSQFITEHVTTNDPDILHGLNPHLRALTENGYSAHSKQRASTIYNENLRNHGASQGDSIDEASGAGLENGLGTDYELLWGALIEQRQGATSTGTLESDYDNMLVESIIAKAIEHGDPQLLEFLDKTIPDEDHSLSSYPQYRDAKAKALDKLERMAVASMTRKDKAQEDSDSEDINQLVLTGVIRTPNGFKTAITELDRMAKSNREGTGILKDGTARMYLKTLKTRTETDTLDVFGVKGLTDAGLAATNHFGELLLDWEERNPDASKIERVEAITRIGDAVMNNISGEDKDSNPTYNRPEPETQLPEESDVQQESNILEDNSVVEPQLSNETEPPIRVHPINGRPLLDNGDGTFSSEESITVTHPNINNGKPTNIPSIWDGRRYDDEEEIVLRAIASGQYFTSFESIPKAVAAVRQRSELLGEAMKKGD